MDNLANTSSPAPRTLWETLQKPEWVLPAIRDYGAMWWQIFLWVISSSLIVHGVAALIACCCLRKHKVGRLYALMVLVMGVIGPVTGGAITTAIIAWIYYHSSSTMPAFYAMCAGLIQTIVLVVISFSRIFATL